MTDQGLPYDVSSGGIDGQVMYWIKTGTVIHETAARAISAWHSTPEDGCCAPDRTPLARFAVSGVVDPDIFPALDWEEDTARDGADDLTAYARLRALRAYLTASEEGDSK